MNKAKLYEYFILCSRVLLAWTFFSYGWGKLTGGQFGISQDQLSEPVNQLGLFKLSWYLFDQEPFKSFIGLFQIFASVLLLFNRTHLFGALLLFSILINILIVNITFIKMDGFYWRLSYYIVLDLLILYNSKEKVHLAFKNLSSGIFSKRKFPIWAYLILPLVAILLEFLIILPKILYGLIFNTKNTLYELNKLPDSFLEFIHKIF